MTKLQLLILVGELGAFTLSCPNVEVPEEFPLARLGDLCTRDLGTSNKLLVCEIRRSHTHTHPRTHGFVWKGRICGQEVRLLNRSTCTVPGVENIALNETDAMLPSPEFIMV